MDVAIAPDGRQRAPRSDVVAADHRSWDDLRASLARAVVGAEDTGASLFEPIGLRLVEGPVFTNVLLVDEINRATPRTQSALLEAMQERQVSVEGTTYPLADPFLVLATQNPVEFEGTFALPHAQLDRFLLRARMGYPDDAGGRTRGWSRTRRLVRH